jgi:hypothetical protein
MNLLKKKKIVVVVVVFVVLSRLRDCIQSTNTCRLARAQMRRVVANHLSLLMQLLMMMLLTRDDARRRQSIPSRHNANIAILHDVSDR